MRQPIAADDLRVLYSDGVTEATNDVGEESTVTRGCVPVWSRCDARQWPMC